jgi:hypothetical protein
MTTSTFYSTSSDGEVYSEDSNESPQPDPASIIMDDIQSGTGTAYVLASAGGSFAYIGQFHNHITGDWNWGSWDPYGNDWGAAEVVYIGWPTSDIPDTDTINSVTASVYGYSSSSTAFTIRMRAKAWGPTLTAADWVGTGSFSGYTLLASRAATTGWTNSGYNEFTSEADFKSNVNKTGTTEVMMSSSLHEAGTDPSVNGAVQRVAFWIGADPGTSRDPKLVVAHSSSALPRMSLRIRSV